MGVRGLTTYINKKQDCFLKYHLLHDCCLVIDGHSLVAQLYSSLSTFSAFGGDYDKFAAQVKKFFQRLKKCNITCYVLFDGSYEHRKLKTAYRRLRSKIYGASKLDAVTQSSMRLFPLFLRDVFKNMLKELEIPYTVCEFEADDEIAAMARYLNCPVLSYDSDFFIYNTLYIPFNTVDSDLTIIDEDGGKTYGIECRLYRIENMLEHFGGLKQEMLPLLATLLGNDFVEKKIFKNFFSQLKLPKIRGKTNEQQRSIHGLLKWLRDETVDSAIEKIIGRLKKQHKYRVSKIIKNSIHGYVTKSCRSLKYFGFNDPDQSKEGLEEKTELLDKIINDLELVGLEDDDTNDSKDSDETDTSDEENDCVIENITLLPEVISEGLRSGSIPQSLINLYTHKLYFCSPQAEDYSQEDSFLSSIPILRYSFDILTNFSNDTFTYVSRERDNYHRLVIENPGSNPLENCLNPLESNEMLPLYFKHFINEKFAYLDLSLFDNLPENYRILMLSILWWSVECKVPVFCIYSLFLCYIMLEVVDEKTGMYRGHNFFNNKYSKRLEELKKRPESNTDIEDLFLNKNKVLYEDCLLAASQLLVFFELSNDIRKRPRSYDSRRVHSFAQFQCCLQQINNLNTLCKYPYKSCKLFNCFNGTFVYNVSKKLEQHENYISYIEQNLLKHAPTVLLYFKSLCKVFDQCCQQLGLTFVKVEGKKNGRRKKKANNNVFLDSTFESEVII